MQNQDQFIDYVLELMQPLGPVRARAVCDGYDICIDDLMFALVADDVLYFKTDANNLPDYQQRGLTPFCYRRDGKTLSMSYSEAPEKVLDDADTMIRWAGRSVDAALRGRTVAR